ncbi:MAG: transcriptional regulator PpsR [Steroidobacteraceae bacterium]
MKKAATARTKLAPEEARAGFELACSSMDISLFIDSKGIIRDVVCADGDLCGCVNGSCRWVGKHWSDTVTPESRPKIVEMLGDTALNGAPRWRQVNHTMPGGGDVPVVYSIARVGDSGRYVAFGRDLRPVAALQQRLVNAQVSMEREYAKLRQVETRYRLLFQISSEAVLVVDATNGRVVEANPAAARLMDATPKRLVGHAFVDHFEPESRVALEALFAAARVSGRGDEATVRLGRGEREFRVSASVFREERATYLLVRAAPASDVAVTTDASQSRVLEAVESMPDGFVVTDSEGHILTANRAFIEMAELPAQQAAEGESLDRWLGRPGVDLSVLLASLREHGSVRMFATGIRGSHGLQTDAEICAVATSDPNPCCGFSIRDVSARLPSAEKREQSLPRSVKQMTELVGRMPLKELVRETTDMIERLCIEAALELSGDNRATAADLLGLSRQSLYVKLRRYGLGELEPHDTNG